MKYFTIITLVSLVFSYIDQPCNAGKYGNGVCVKKSSCTLIGNQKGSAYAYEGSAPDGHVQMILMMLFVVLNMSQDLKMVLHIKTAIA